MSLDYRTMAPGDWFWLGAIALLCLVVFLGFWLKPARPWKTVQRLRNPDLPEEEMREPTKRFLIAVRIFGLLFLLLGVVVLLLPFLPLLK